jgi:hypothetical protein
MLREWLKEKNYDPEAGLIITIETSGVKLDTCELLAVCVADPATDKVETCIVSGVDKDIIAAKGHWSGIDGPYYDKVNKIHIPALELLLETLLQNKQFIVGFSLDAPGASGQFTRNWLQRYFPGIFRGKQTLDVTVMHKLGEKSKTTGISSAPADLAELMQYTNQEYAGKCLSYKKLFPLLLPSMHEGGRVFEDKINNMLDLYNTMLDRNYT